MAPACAKPLSCVANAPTTLDPSNEGLIFDEMGFLPLFQSTRLKSSGANFLAQE